MAGIIRRRAIGSMMSPVYLQQLSITRGGCGSPTCGRYGDVQQRDVHTQQKQRQVIRCGCYVNDGDYYPHTYKCRHSLSRRHVHNQSTGARCVESRYIHSQSTEDSDANNNIKHQKIILSHKSDPTAKRPTRKCDPYGLRGESLSSAKCLEWMSTLEGGWTLLDSTEKDMTTTINNLHESMTDTATATAPKFLQKQYYHHTLHDASRFLSHISLVATNINHYPFLSMERILVDDVNNIHSERGDNQMDETGTTDNSSLDTDNSGDNEVPRKRKRKIKGWAFRSTIRCSTYRPPTSGSNSQDMNKSESLHKDKGLTYHDFHLAMSVDIEVNRKEVKHLLWSAPQEE